jgi:segregation and condensation protein B
MTRDEAKRIIEVLLFVSEKPLGIDSIARVIDGFDKNCIQEMVGELNDEYARTGRAFSAVEVAGGFQIMTDPFYAPWLRKLFSKERKQRLSTPSLETLSIIAYKQPVTRAEIESIRGVNIEGVLETLLERDLVKVAGRREIPGRPFVYGTTKNFLMQFGLNSLEDLPKLKDFDEKDIQLGKDELVRKEGEDPISEPVSDQAREGDELRENAEKVSDKEAEPHVSEEIKDGKDQKGVERITQTD